MPKPPNVAPVYPLRSEFETTLIESSSKPLVIFNPELEDPASLMKNNDALTKMLKTLSEMDIDLAVMATPSTTDTLNKEVANLKFKNSIKVYSTETVFDLKLKSDTGAKIFWLS
jgi:hypothetical protein